MKSDARTALALFGGAAILALAFGCGGGGKGGPTTTTTTTTSTTSTTTTTTGKRRRTRILNVRGCRVPSARSLRGVKEIA